MWVLVLVLIIGDERFGGQRWLLNGSIQPSELSKLAIIIYIADWLSSKGEQIRKVSYGLILFAILLGVITGLIVLQRDLGTAVMIASTSLAMFFIASGNLWQIIISGILGGATIIFLTLQSDYRWARVLNFLTAFLDPLHADPLGAGYQIRQILIALGSGGITGLGLGASRQKSGYIPATHTDSLFAILGEELGVIGSLAVLGLFAFLAYRGFRIAMFVRVGQQSPDGFARHR